MDNPVEEAHSGITVQEIRDRIWNAIAERKLRPGTRLKEEQLAEIFQASRARIRQALSLLDRDRLVTLIPNRGGFVAEPNHTDAACARAKPTHKRNT